MSKSEYFSLIISQRWGERFPSSFSAVEVNSISHCGKLPKVLANFSLFRGSPVGG